MHAHLVWWFLVLLALTTPPGLLAQVAPPSGGGSSPVFPVTTCVGSVGVGITTQGILTCMPVTPAMVTGLVPSGADVTAVGQVVATHLALPLPFSQGGLGITAGQSGGVLYLAGPQTVESSPTLALNAPLFGGGAGSPPLLGLRSGTTLEVATVLGPHTTGKQLMFDALGNVVASGADVGGSGGGGNGAVASVFGRTGAILAAVGDYTAEQVTNAAHLLGANVFAHPSGQTMPRLNLAGTISGTLSLRAPAVAGTTLLTFPAGTLDMTLTGGPGHVVKQGSAAGPLTVGPVMWGEVAGTAGVCTTDSVCAGYQAVLGFTPETVANKSTTTSLGTSNVLYPSQNAVKNYVDTAVATKQAVLGFTPENVTNKSTATALGASDTLYPSQAAVKAYVDTGLAGKQASLGFTPENVTNKSTATALGTSDTLYPSQAAVKTYVDTGLAGKQAGLGFTPENVANKSTATSLGTSHVLYPSQAAVKTYVDTAVGTKQETLGFTPENVANKSTATSLGTSHVLYPSQAAVKAYVDTAIAEIVGGGGFAPENVANKSASTTLGTSDTLYPTQQAVKVYVDTGLATKQASLGFAPENSTNKSTATSLGTSNVLYPSQAAVKTYVDTLQTSLESQLAGKQASLGFTPENVTNKSTTTSLGTSNVLYPSQAAVKAYVDTGLAGKQASLGFTPENTANKSTATALGASDTLYPSQAAVKTYVDTGLAGKQNSFTTSASLAAALSDETGTGGAVFALNPVLITPNLGTPSAVVLTNATGLSLSTGVVDLLPYANLTPATTSSQLLGRGSASPGPWQGITLGAGLIMSGTTLSATGSGTSLLLQEIDGSPSGTPSILKVSNDSLLNNGDGTFTLLTGGSVAEALTYAAGVKIEGMEVSTASDEPGFLFPGTTDLTDGGGQSGKMQVRTDGSLEYTDGATPAVRRRGFVLPSPFKFNLGTGSGCKTDANGGALTINASDEVVCKSDVVGEGGGGAGDLTAFGSCATGDCATTGSPLTSYWMSGLAPPGAPTTGQGRIFFDQTAKNFAVIADDSAIKYGAQVIVPTEHFFLTSFAADGTFSAARPSLATLSDNATVARLSGPQTVTNTQVVPRVCPLSATSGSVTPNLDLCDVVYRYDVAGALTVETPTATGLNPRPEQLLTFDLCAAAAQSLTWSSAYAGNYGLALPATLPAGRCMALAYRYSPNSAKYELWSVHESNPLLQTLRLQGTTSGVVTLQPQAAAGTYNFNLPTTAGTTGQMLTSGGGGASPMTWTTPVTGGGTGTIHLFVASPKLPTSNAALVDSGGNFYKLIFDDTVAWCAWWQFNMPTDYTGSLVFEANYSPVGATTGTLNFDVSVMAVTPGASADFNTDSYATANACNDAAIPTTAGHIKRVSCPLTNTDGAAPEDSIRLRVCRNMADTAATQIELIDPVLQYAK